MRCVIITLYAGFSRPVSAPALFIPPPRQQKGNGNVGEGRRGLMIDVAEASYLIMPSLKPAAPSN